MIIQSLSVVVPNKACINNCVFCVSRMRKSTEINLTDDNLPLYDLYEREYRKRLEFARDNGCNTVMLTGTSEPQQNRAFLKRFGTMNNSLDRPFRWIEMQTTGTLIDDTYLSFLRNHVGVNTISLSLSSFAEEENSTLCGMVEQVGIARLCNEIKAAGFNLRLSLNMSKYFEQLSPVCILDECRTLNADQVTFRKLYTTKAHTDLQSEWILQNQYTRWNEIIDLIRRDGSALEVLPFGATKYAIYGMSVVLDDDCMSKEAKDVVKYLILRPDCKLYSRWDEKASLIF